MHLNLIYEKKSGKHFMVFVETYKDSNNRQRSKTVEKIGYLEDYLHIYDDPKAHFKDVAKQRSIEKKAKESDKIITCRFDRNEEITFADEDQYNILIHYGDIILSHAFNILKLDKLFKAKDKFRIIKQLVFKDVFTLNNASYFDDHIATNGDIKHTLEYLVSIKDELFGSIKRELDKQNIDSKKSFCFSFKPINLILNREFIPLSCKKELSEDDKRALIFLSKDATSFDNLLSSYIISSPLTDEYKARALDKRGYIFYNSKDERVSSFNDDTKYMYKSLKRSKESGITAYWHRDLEYLIIESKGDDLLIIKTYQVYCDYNKLFNNSIVLNEEAWLIKLISLLIITFLRKTLDNKYTIDEIISSLSKATFVKLDRDNYYTAYYDKIIESLLIKLNLPMIKKAYTKRDLKELFLL